VNILARSGTAGGWTNLFVRVQGKTKTCAVSAKLGVTTILEGSVLGRDRPTGPHHRAVVNVKTVSPVVREPMTVS
jgi:hypothetical protein